MGKQRKILIFIKNMKDPSAYYRLGQYITEQDKDRKVKYARYVPNSVYRYYYDSSKGNIQIKKAILALCGIVRITHYILWDMVIYHTDTIIVNRQMFPRIMPFYGKKLLSLYLRNRKVYWDFDDNIIFDNEITQTEDELLERHAKVIVVTNEYLKDTIKTEYHSKVRLLPTTDAIFRDMNLEKVNQKRSESNIDIINIVWIGTKSNLPFLEQVILKLDVAAREVETQSGKKLILKVVCNENLQCSTTHLSIKNVQWTRTRAEKELLNAYIGIMPLADTEFTKGKGGFKGIQYISAGIPCIMSNVGYNSQVIEDGISGFLAWEPDDWVEKIVQLCTDKEKWENMSIAARKRWEQKFNSDENKEFWNQLLNNDTDQ